jgi:hypothetical protein
VFFKKFTEKNADILPAQQHQNNLEDFVSSKIYLHIIFFKYKKQNIFLVLMLVKISSTQKEEKLVCV